MTFLEFADKHAEGVVFLSFCVLVMMTIVGVELANAIGKWGKK